MYNYSRNTTARREVNVKETTASIREKRQMESRRRVEAVAKNAELRAKKTRLLHSRVATADEEKDENVNDYGPSVTHVVGNFERKRRHVDETRWTLDRLHQDVNDLRAWTSAADARAVDLQYEVKV